MIDKICNEFLDVISVEDKPCSAWVTSYEEPSEPKVNQFIFFFKPEATAIHEGVDLGKVLNWTLKKLVDCHVELGAIRILNGAYLHAYQIMDQHYGVINEISKKGFDALSEGAKKNLQQHFGDLLKAPANIYGAHQFLEINELFNAYSLCAINDNMGTKKLGGGTYALVLNLEGETFVLLNPFHPQQLIPYTTPGRGIIVLEGRSQENWQVLREEIAGATDPKKAREGSIREFYLQEQASFGFKVVNQGANGIHLSAGPLEGMVELCRFFGEEGQPLEFSNTAFGRLLLESGKSESEITGLSQNPDIQFQGEILSAFDLSENVNAWEALEKF